MSIYYPSALGTGTGKDPSGPKRWSRQVWLPHPRSAASKGYAAFAQLPGWLVLLWLFMTTWFTKLPSFTNARLAYHWPPERDAKESGFDMKDEQGDPPTGQPEKPVFPLIMFSHGLGGSRTAYNSLCGEFASHGFVVCAVEHRDGTGARTLINHPSQSRGSRPEREHTGKVDQYPEEADKTWDGVNFIFPDKSHMDTHPSNDIGIDKELRSAQIDMRLAEVEEAYEIIKAIVAGQGAAVQEQNLRNAQGIGSSSRGLEGVDWDCWVGRVNTMQVTMVGHSFGAAATVEILRHAERFRWVGQGIIYDVWGMSLNPSGSDPRHRIRVPLLGINSEAFMYWSDNYRAAVRVCDEAKMHGSLAWLLTVRGTVHVSQSDFCILYPHLASLFLKQTIDPQRTIDVNISTSLEFLARVMPRPVAPFQRCLTPEHLLDLPCAEELPTEHKPDEKWTAVRLKVRHRIRSCVLPKVRRKLKKYGGTVGEEKEIWMHLAPSAEELQRNLLGRGCPIKEEALHPLEKMESKGLVSASVCVWPVANG